MVIWSASIWHALLRDIWLIYYPSLVIVGGLCALAVLA